MESWEKIVKLVKCKCPQSQVRMDIKLHYDGAPPTPEPSAEPDLPEETEPEVFSYYSLQRLPWNSGN